MAKWISISGYGDLPFGNAKAFVAIYVLLGVGIVANIMNDIFTLVCLDFTISVTTHKG